MTERKKRNLVVLKAHDGDDVLVNESNVDVHEFYDGSVELIDSSEYRRNLGVRRVEGWISSIRKARSISISVNHDSASGEYTGVRSEHADGTITED